MVEEEAEVQAVIHKVKDQREEEEKEEEVEEEVEVAEEEEEEIKVVREKKIPVVIKRLAVRAIQHQCNAQYASSGSLTTKTTRTGCCATTLTVLHGTMLIL